ncbi:hypothetical protein HELRODRAFT_163308 [Helobdella robusta]|uniref:Uncharacterized protein n=1 Tax=Helobdella robusta TaxID=6412 RepID=T1ETW1_HELRO|nr:hypothetical protein HELRODRAFT_163308 [Helobdella robusta]ESN96261.1 hypothetical protein HELRODRAFT_163308 [Helobdella robusta]
MDSTEETPLLNNKLTLGDKMRQTLICINFNLQRILKFLNHIFCKRFGVSKEKHVGSIELTWNLLQCKRIKPNFLIRPKVFYLAVLASSKRHKIDRVSLKRKNKLWRSKFCKVKPSTYKNRLHFRKNNYREIREEFKPKLKLSKSLLKIFNQN